jgi:VanZ like family.
VPSSSLTPMSFTGTKVYIMPAGIGSVNLSRITYDLGFIENIALTVPLGFLIKQAFSNISLISMVPVGLMTGAAIETMQYYLSHVFLINRTSDISDVVANGIGIVVGSLLVLIYRYVYEQKLLEKWL